MIAPQVAYDKLAQFQTADEIAEYLECEGFVGYKKSPFHCPIARFMSTTTELTITVSPSIIVGGYKWAMTPTDPIRHFIVAFDQGAFPNLEALELPEK